MNWAETGSAIASITGAATGVAAFVVSLRALRQTKRSNVAAEENRNIARRVADRGERPTFDYYLEATDTTENYVFAVHVTRRRDGPPVIDMQIDVAGKLYPIGWGGVSEDPPEMIDLIMENAYKTEQSVRYLRVVAPNTCWAMVASSEPVEQLAIEVTVISTEQDGPDGHPRSWVDANRMTWQRPGAE